MVLLQEPHYTLAPVCHVLAYHECQMPCFDVLVMGQNLWSERVSDPVRVFLVRNYVVCTRKDGNRYLFDIAELDQFCLALRLEQIAVAV